MTIDKRPIGLPIEEPSLATWWPRLDFAFVDAGNEYVATGGAQSGGSADIQFGVAYVGTGGAQSGGAADVVYTQVVPSLTISGTIRVQIPTEGTRVQLTTSEIRVQSLPQNIRVQVVEPAIVVTLLAKAA